MGDFEAWTPVQVESPLKYHPCKIDFLTLIFFKQKTAYEISACLVGSEMCIRDSTRKGKSMGNRLIFLYQLEVTDLVNCMSLMDWTCSEQVPRNSSNIDRTINRHRWSGREYRGG